MPVVYITSDRPGGGKTAVASALAAQLSKAGKGVGYLKPLFHASQEDADVTFIGGNVLSPGDVEAQPLPQTAVEGAGNVRTLPAGAAGELRLSIERIASANEVVLVEGPSLSTSDGEASVISAELAETLDARVLLVVHYRPGLDVEHVTEMSQPFGQRLLGVLLNSVTRYKERESRLNLASAIEGHGIKFLGAIPEDRLMMSVTVGQIADHLNGRWVLGQEKSGELVENFLIGANIMDQGITYFGREESKAVIVRGDRPDIQLAALSTPTTCLVLTGGHEPIQYVYYQAEQEEVPLLVVQSDTVSTAHALDTVLRRATFHQLSKLGRFQELMGRHVDLAAFDLA